MCFIGTTTTKCFTSHVKKLEVQDHIGGVYTTSPEEAESPSNSELFHITYFLNAKIRVSAANDRLANGRSPASMHHHHQQKKFYIFIFPSNFSLSK